RLDASGGIVDASVTLRSFVHAVAGTRRVPATAAVLATLLAAGPVGAGTSDATPPASKRSAADEPLITPEDLAPRTPTTGVVVSGARPLRLLAAEASAVVLADVVRTEPFDEDRLHLIRLRVARVLGGRLDDLEPGVAEIRGASKRPPVLADGERVVVLLRP